MLHDERLATPRSGEIAAKVIDGEAIIMNLSNGMYYSMDQVGAAIWTLAESGHTVGRIGEVLAARFGIDRQTANRDVADLIEHLASEELVVVSENGGSHGAPADAPIPEFDEGQPYTPPVLNRYDDMADLLALDPPMPGLAGTGFDG
jgi:hypothetical protein